MRRFTLLVMVLGLVVVAIPASAATVKVNAAENVTRWDHKGEFCDVQVDDYLDMEVTVYCFSTGRTWFKVRVPGVTGRVTKVGAGRDGDCSGAHITYSKRGSVVSVKIVNVGEFECTYKNVSVRFN